MPLPSITLAEFNKIASGQQNAGQVDFETNSNGEFTGGLVKINNHIIRKRPFMSTATCATAQRRTTP